MLLFPQKYEELQLGVIEKRLINFLRSKLNDDWFVFLKINPTDHFEVDFALINKKAGILLIKIDNYHNVEKFGEYLRLIYPGYQNKEKQVFKKLKNHRFLSGESGLKFNFFSLHLFPNIKKPKNFDFKETIKFFENQCAFKEDILDMGGFLELIKTKISSSIHQEKVDNVNFDEEIINTILQHIAPEYVVPRIQKIIWEKENSFDKVDINLNQDDQGIKVFRLDDDQIYLINKINFGPNLMLACAGSGKSALLIAKAFRVAGQYPNKNVLVTCFNRNLADFYLWRIQIAGFREKNVGCYSFFGLVKKLLDSNNIKYRDDYEVNFENWFEVAKEALEKGKIKERFFAIFIDEIQIFKKEWLKFCFNLLEQKKDNSFVFVICGDKSQNVNDNIKKGEAPWQIPEEGFPIFDNSNTIRIENNYRNNKPINSFLNSFVGEAKEYFSLLNMPEGNDSDLFLRGRSNRLGVEPTVIQTNRMDEKEEIIKIVKTLNYEKGLPLDEIAVIFYNKQFKPMKYFPLNWLTKELDKEGILYSTLLTTGDIPDRYQNREGITLLTIESALGLDFRAIILCGLLPMGVYRNINKENFLRKNVISPEDKQEFFKCINQIYTGCTRARDYLFILLTEPKERNIFSKIITDSLEKVNHNDSF